ncbi:hypothetical protein [Paraeggerthella sp. Marseille-Q4926]|uniref:hypothetical protein n=1 Tax=Paraeggerthella sp. Marseille-Q4926 TaxID=2866587 RepID=UPI001CE3CA14|nr:hypothetical protein [Paraeggerthella sp. Marseille-Q4926]
MKTFEEMVALFEQANKDFLFANQDLFEVEVSERTLCGALMICIHELISRNGAYSGYYADVEYNRNEGDLKTICKTMRGADGGVVRITCDLILHSRGHHPEQDNLIAMEMKKSSGHPEDKDKDRERLRALTKDSYDDVWVYDGYSFPEHVCRYVLGVYYEINFSDNDILLEYYRQGLCVNTYHMPCRCDLRAGI